MSVNETPCVAHNPEIPMSMAQLLNVLDEHNDVMRNLYDRLTPVMSKGEELKRTPTVAATTPLAQQLQEAIAMTQDATIVGRTILTRLEL